MTGVIAGDNESFENLLKRFNKRVQQAGILSEIRHGEYFEKPSIKRKRKEAAKKRKSMKAIGTTPTRAPMGRPPMNRAPAPR